MKQTIKRPSAADLARLESQLRAAVHFADAHSPEDAGQPMTLAVLDRAYAAWFATGTTDTQKIDAAVHCVGLALGQFLVDELGLQWVVAGDEHGIDLAVCGPGNLLFYPSNFVRQRWHRRETNFLETTFHEIAGRVSAAAEAEPPRRPWWKFW